MSSFRCRVFCIVIILVLGSICQRSSLVYSKNGPEYLIRRTIWWFPLPIYSRICNLLLLLLLLLESFSHQRRLIIFHRSLSDSNSPQISRTLLSIQADLNNAVVCMVSTRPPISKCSSFSTKPLVTVPSTPITIGMVSPSLSCFIAFSFRQGLHTYLSFRFLSVLPCGQPERQRPLFGRFSFFVDYHLVG